MARVGPTDDVVREKAIAKGFEYIRSYVKVIGGRNRLRVVARCPADIHECDIEWDNFKREERGCPACSKAAVGAAKRADHGPWLRQHGIEPIDDYKSETTQMRWRCVANHHEFPTTFQSLKKKPHPCTQCYIDEMQRRHNITLLTPWRLPTDQLEWACDICGKEFPLAITSLSVAGKFCPSCP